jgi:hypothetical protein
MDVINQHLDKENIVFTNNSKTNSIQGSWEEFKLIRKTVSSKLDESHQNYISQLLEVGEAGERKTLSVISSPSIILSIVTVSSWACQRFRKRTQVRTGWFC